MLRMCLRESPMRRSLLTIGIAVAVACCGVGTRSLASPSIDGVWSAYSDGLGSTLTMTLSSTGTAVSGTGTYSVGAVRTGSVVIAGTYRPPAVVLTITYDHGETVTFAADVTGGEHMKGKLTDRSGTVRDVEFVRP
jgi:hypothetical protein